MSERHGENMRRLAHELFPEAAHDAGFDAFVDLGISALQGAAISRPLRRDGDDAAPMLAMLTTFLRQIVQPGQTNAAVFGPCSEPQASDGIGRVMNLAYIAIPFYIASLVLEVLVTRAQGRDSTPRAGTPPRVSRWASAAC